MKWKLKSSIPVFESPYISLFNNTYELPNGKIGEEYYHMSRPDYVLIVAVSDQNRIVVEKQYRRGVDDIVYEVPAGFIDKNETPIQAAVREFKEETGYSGKGTRTIEIYPQPGFSSMKAHLVFLEFNEDETSNQNLGDDEIIEFELKTIEQVQDMVKRGEIKDMGSLGALGVYLASK